MTSKWKEIRLGDIAEVKGGKRLPKGSKLTNIPNNHPYIKVRNMGKQKIIQLDSEYEYVDNEAQKVIGRYIVSAGDILISVVGTVGLVSMVGDTLDKANQTENCDKITNFRNIDADFLYYYLISPVGQEEIHKRTVGAVQAKLPLKSILELPIKCPDVLEQKKISDILSIIDKKIDNNNKINKNLSEQISTLCNSWLSDYEPFGGVIPSNWELTPLSEIASFTSGYSYKGNELQESNIAMATIKNFERKGGFKLDGFKEIIPSSKLKPTQHAELFDTLVAHTDLTQNADVIGNAEPLLSFAGYKDIVFSMDVVKVLPSNPDISKFLIAAILQDKKFKSHCLGYVNGTTVLHLSKKALPDYQLMLPKDLSVLKPLDNVVKTLYMQIAHNIDESVKLANIRDYLLPKLMSGEIDVSDLSI